MSNKLMTGIWRLVVGIPPQLWERQLTKTKARIDGMIGRLSADHRAVHHFVVRELPRIGEPLSPARVSEGMGLPVDDVARILDDLEQRLTFVARNVAGEVTWAYPVTVERTPHRVRFDSGETLYAA